MALQRKDVFRGGAVINELCGELSCGDKEGLLSIYQSPNSVTVRLTRQGAFSRMKLSFYG